MTLPPILGGAPESGGPNTAETRPRNAAGVGLSELSTRQREVLTLLKEGLPNKQIAARMGIQEVTVKLHLSKVFSKLGATNRTEAARIAIESDPAGPQRLGNTRYRQFSKLK